MTIQELAQKISDNLTTITIKGGDEEPRAVWKDEAPEELRQWFQDTTADSTGYSFAELDECYRVLEDLCDIITDEDEDAGADKLEEAIYSHEWAYIYNADLLDWVKENLYRISDVDEALEEGSPGIIEAIQQAMDRTRSGYALTFLNKMQDYIKEEAQL